MAQMAGAHALQISAKPVLLALALLGSSIFSVAGLSFLAERAQEAMSDKVMTSDVRKLPVTEVALVLGTSPMKVDTEPNPFFNARLDAAATLWKAHKAKYLLVSGSHVADYDEPSAMRQGLIDRGVPAQAIYRDGEGFRTWDSMVRARDIFGQRRLTVVSQRSQLARALFIASALGVRAYGFEAEDDMPLELLDRLRQYPAAVLSFLDSWRGELPIEIGSPIRIGADPPN